MLAQLERLCVVDTAEFLPGPYIARLHPALHTGFFQVQANAAQEVLVFAEVDDGKRTAAVGQRTRPDLDRALLVDALGLRPRRPGRWR